MSLRNIKLTLAYDGSDFLGWQIQKSGRTVQGILQDALNQMHGSQITCTAAGRTDSGVHATGQIVNFRSSLNSIPPERYRDAINTHLPEDVRVIASELASDSFNARRSARWRLYRYYLYCAQVGYPHLRRYCLKIRRQPDIGKLNRLASKIVGKHDFTVFAAAGDKNKLKIREVLSSCFYPEGPFIVYKIAANSFCGKWCGVLWVSCWSWRRGMPIRKSWRILFNPGTGNGQGRLRPPGVSF